MSLDRVINILVTITLIEMMVLVGLRMTFNELAQTAKKPRLVARAVMANYLLFPGVTIALLMLFRASNVSSDWIPRSRSPPPPPDRVRARPVLHLEEPAAKSSNFVACSTGWRRAARPASAFLSEQTFGYCPRAKRSRSASNGAQYHRGSRTPETVLLVRHHEIKKLSTVGPVHATTAGNSN
jgi:hypothetical protein